MKATVYLETSVVSYLTALPSRDLIVAAHQQVTHEWWRLQRPKFDLVISPYVLMEAAKGDPQMITRRLAVLSGIPVLEETPGLLQLARKYCEALHLPKSKSLDAFHLAAASWHRVDYLLTWNCRHIASVQIRRALLAANLPLGLPIPGLCTPEELEA